MDSNFISFYNNDYFKFLLSVFGSLIFVIFIIVLAFKLILNFRILNINKKRFIKIIDICYLGNKEKIILLEVKNFLFVLGVISKKIVLLYVINKTK